MKKDNLKNGWIPIDEKGRKRFRLDWKSMGLIFIFLVAVGLVKSLKENKTVQQINAEMPVLQAAIKNLSQEEADHFNSVRINAWEVYRKYLTEEEFNDFDLITRKQADGTSVMGEIDRGISYMNRVKSKSTPAEKEILNEWQQLILKLAGRRK